MPKIAFGADKVVKIGFLAPLTGAVAAWGKPGLDGLHIWADRVNGAGGVPIGGDSYKVEFVAYDDEYDPGKARTGAVKLIGEDGVKFIMMLGGDPWPGVFPVASKEKMLVSTLLPSDLTPDTTMLVAPCEVHPIYNVTGVEWLAENKPDMKTAVICAQDNSLGKPSVATYLAAFEAAGIKVLGDPIFFDPATTDFAPIMSKMLAAEAGHSLPRHLLCRLCASSHRAGIPAGFQGPDHLMHGRLLSQDDRQDLQGIHGGLHLPVPGLRRSGAQRAANQLQGPERVLRGVQEALRRGRMERRVVGIFLHHEPVG